jgi:F0F1-type ATP synthase alpha subunit
LGPSTESRKFNKRTQRIASLKVGEQMVGRVVNTLGFQLMEKDQLVELYKCLWKEKLLELSSVNQLLSHYKQVLKQ